MTAQQAARLSPGRAPGVATTFAGRAAPGIAGGVGGRNPSNPPRPRTGLGLTHRIFSGDHDSRPSAATRENLTICNCVNLSLVPGFAPEFLPIHRLDPIGPEADDRAALARPAARPNHQPSAQE